MHSLGGIASARIIFIILYVRACTLVVVDGKER